MVDDNTVMRKIVRRVLERWSLRIDEAKDGQEAIRMVKASVDAQDDYDVVIMDLEMPVCDGFEATKEIRRLTDDDNNNHNNNDNNNNRKRSRTPIFALTAHIFESAKKQFLEAGGDDFLMKPLRVELLKEKIGMYL